MLETPTPSASCLWFHGLGLLGAFFGSCCCTCNPCGPLALSRTRLSASKWPWLWLLPGIFHGVWAPHLYGKHIGKKTENRIDTGPRCLMFFWTDALYCLKMDYTVLDFIERWLEKNISLFVYGRTAMMLGNNFAIICMNRLPAKKQQPALLNPSAKVVSDTGLLHK